MNIPNVYDQLIEISHRKENDKVQIDCIILGISIELHAVGDEVTYRCRNFDGTPERVEFCVKEKFWFKDVYANRHKFPAPTNRLHSAWERKAVSAS